MTSLETLGPIEPIEYKIELNPVYGHNALSGLHGSFESTLSAASEAFDNAILSPSMGLVLFTGIEDAALLQSLRPSIMDAVDIMLNGGVDGLGNQTLGLNGLAKWKLNSQYHDQNLKQQAGFAAEIISTAKENIHSFADSTGLTTFRADNRPDLGFVKNDQLVDKVRVNAAGEIVERIQTKFIGKNGTEWVQKMMSKKFEKYLDGVHVDKIECPKDFFDEAKAYIAHRREKLGEQLARVTADGKIDAVESIKARLAKLNRLDEMIEQSLVTTDEARYAREHPLRFAAKVFGSEIAKESLEEGLSGAASAAKLTFVTSAVIHGTECLSGEITVVEMAHEVATETGVAAGVGGATAFVSTAIANTMQTSSCNLIREIGGSCLPANAIAFAVESYDSAMDFAQGSIGADELLHDLGLNATTIAGGAAGAQTGAAVGLALGPLGSAAGGLVGGMIGSAVASGAYETAVQYVPETAGNIAGQVKAYAKETIDIVASEYPGKVESVRASFNGFFADNNIPVQV